MRVFYVCALGVFILLSSPVFGQDFTSKSIKNFEEDELELLAGDDDLDALSMSLLEADLAGLEADSRDLARETAQARMLRDHVQAEINLLNREIQLYQDQLDRIAENLVFYEEKLEKLQRTNERLMVENDALTEDRRIMEEDDRQTVLQNSQQLQDNEARIASYDKLVEELYMEELELEDLIEENNETIERQMELLEVCEDIIQTNELIMQPSGE